ncbi:uncharacterized protein LOC118456384 [Anopheles albimanus]|uniref:Uncharacterized protein n=1 Tax=Anopheles albimanus TaxID=7167 RepID=A0A1Y9G8C6_ANOAL|nr:uncharacterized protein LOC118456384 [Anopheles albimanus]
MFLRRSAALLVRAFSSSGNAANVAGSHAEAIATRLEGVDKELVRELLVTVPELNKYTFEHWERTHRLLASEGLEPDRILSIIGGHPDILVRQEEKVADSLHCWRSCQFGDVNTKVLLSAHPYLLDYTNHGQLAQRVAFLHSHFETRKNVFRLFLNAPNLLTDEQRVTEEKITFLLVQMRHEVLEVAKSFAFRHDIEHLRCRHTFLERLGMFKPKPLKADKETPSGNPSLHQIIDTSDKRFAVKVAYVTLEEYEVFQELFRRELEQELGRNSLELDDGDELDYEDEQHGEPDQLIGDRGRKAYRKGTR